jgi:hypothetical protein
MPRILNRSLDFWEICANLIKIKQFSIYAGNNYSLSYNGKNKIKHYRKAGSSFLS